MSPIAWLIVFVILVVIEILTLGLTTIWFAGGALVACLCSFLGAGLWIQCILFLVVSVLLLWLTRPWAVKHFNSTREKTNVDGLIGKTAVVLENIDTAHCLGRVTVDGMEWSAKTDNHEGLLLKGSFVEIIGVEGVKLIVRKKEEMGCQEK